MLCVGLLGVVAMAGAGLQVDWPQFHAVGLMEVTRSTGIFNCSGIRVRRNLVLTSAHCIDGADSARFTTHSNPFSHVDPWLKGHAAFIHPSYNPRDMEIKEEANFRNDVAAVCIPPEGDGAVAEIWSGPKVLPADTAIVRIGWGLRHGVNARNWTDPTLLEQSERGFLVTRDEFGVFGDSGGALFAHDSDNVLRVIGIHSTWQQSPNQKKSFAVSLASIKDWLDSIRCPGEAIGASRFPSIYLQ